MSNQPCPRCGKDNPADIHTCTQMSGDHNANQKAVGCPTLGEYLRGLRLCQDEMSLERMAERIGCSKSYLWDVENDQVMPTLAKAAVMAKHYKTSLNQMGRYL